MKSSEHRSGGFVLLLLLVLLGLAWPYLPRAEHPNAVVEALHSLGSHAVEVPLSREETGRLGSIKVRKWLVNEDGIEWTVVVAEGNRGQSKLHDPAYCFVGEGWGVVKKQPWFLEQGKGVIFTVQKNSQQRLCAYLFFNGRSAYESPLKYWFDTALNNITLGWLGTQPVMVILFPPRDLRAEDWENCSMKLMSAILGQ